MTPSEVLHFWFEEAGPEKWFVKDDAFDASIKERFGTLIGALETELKEKGSLDWEKTAEGALAAIIVLDQFPRNIYRASEKAFAFDALALGLSKRVIAQGADKTLTPQQRNFIYMPFMHSEVLADQDMCVAYFKEKDDEMSLHHAEEHRDVIRRFGRFPHRNEVLGRTSTQEEITFLNEGGYTP